MRIKDLDDDGMLCGCGHRHLPGTVCGKWWRYPDVREPREWRRLAEGSTGDDPVWETPEYVNTCHVVDSGCTAPAGMLGAGGAILEGLEPADFECEMYGEWTCESCSNGDGVCNMCVEDYGEDFD